jgi:hypothetical protein
MFVKWGRKAIIPIYCIFCLKVGVTPLSRHRDLKITQVYMGKVSDSEAIRWMDILHGKYLLISIAINQPQLKTQGNEYS